MCVFSWTFKISHFFCVPMGLCCFLVKVNEIYFLIKYICTIDTALKPHTCLAHIWWHIVSLITLICKQALPLIWPKNLFWVQCLPINYEMHSFLIVSLFVVWPQHIYMKIWILTLYKWLKDWKYPSLHMFNVYDHLTSRANSSQHQNAFIAVTMFHITYTIVGPVTKQIF